MNRTVDLQPSEPREPGVTTPDEFRRTPGPLNIRVKVDEIRVPWYVGWGKRLKIAGRVLLLVFSKAGGTVGGIAAGTLALLREFNILQIEEDEMSELETPQTDPKTTDSGKKGVYALIGSGLLVLLGVLGVEIPIEITDGMTANAVYVFATLGGAVFARYFYKQAKDSKDSEVAAEL